jgi:hypothetical protein
MTKLSDTQSLLLSAAAQRSDGNVLPLPGSLRGGAAGKVVGALLARGLVREQVVDSTRAADPALNTIWRNLEDGRGVLLLVTSAAFEALGIEAHSDPVTADEVQDGVEADEGAEPAPAARSTRDAGSRRRTREGTKQAAVVAMLTRPNGATIPEIVAATGWQPHTVRGAFAGAPKKRLGLEVTSEKIEGRGRVYRIAC